MHLPEAPAPAQPWDPPVPNEDEKGQRRRLAEGGPPRHCGQQEGTCRDAAAVTTKQRRRMELLSRLTATPEPDLRTMSHTVANKWLAERWAEYLAQ